MRNPESSWRKQALAFVFAFANLSTLFSQNGDVFPDRDTSAGTNQMYNILMAQREVEYFMGPVYFNSSKFGLTHDSVPSRHALPFVEANIAPYYVMFKGRDLQRPLYRRFSFVLEPHFVLRIYLTKSQSYPSRPINSHPKIHFNYFLHRNINALTRSLSYLTFTAAHLSNGQPDPFFLDPVNKVVNLRSGNFSTNYLRLGYTYGRYLYPRESNNDLDGWQRNLLFTAAIAYQREMSFGKFLAFEKGQDEVGYGRNRITSRLQLRSGNFVGARALLTSYSQPPVFQAFRAPVVERDTTVMEDGIAVTKYFISPCVVIRTIPEKKMKHPRGYWNWMTRLDHVWVLDRKAVNPHALDFIFEIRNLNWRSFSFVAKCSWGRDYLNLRFQDNIQSYQLGISYNMDRYKVPYTRYLNAYKKGDVIDPDYTPNQALSQHSEHLGPIENFAETDSARTIYDMELMPRPELTSVSLLGRNYEQIPLFRFQNGTWAIVTENADLTRRIRKKGWYDANSLKREQEMSQGVR